MSGSQKSASQELERVCPGWRDACAATRACVAAISATLLSVILASCASIERLPAVPLAMGQDIRPLDIPFGRFYYDGDPAELRALAREVDREIALPRAASRAPRWTRRGAATFLAISGGGDDGAFGAGLLVGWTARGDRPQFNVVTGISTGALSAPFAFLGPEYDHALKSVYTETSASDIFSDENPVVSIISGDAATDTTPLKKLIAKYRRRADDPAHRCRSTRRGVCCLSRRRTSIRLGPSSGTSEPSLKAQIRGRAS